MRKIGVGVRVVLLGFWDWGLVGLGVRFWGFEGRGEPEGRE